MNNDDPKGERPDARTENRAATVTGPAVRTDGGEPEASEPVELDESTETALIERAQGILDRAYVPYSGYRVGAALRTADGETFTGTNIETANFSNSLHAEEVALAEAIKNGHTEFTALAVVSGADDGVTPCGMCRQSLAEFCPDWMPVVTVEDGERIRYTLGELLPAAFTGDSLPDGED